MILVTTGYHVPFVRLFRAVDAYAAGIDEPVIVQGRLTPEYQLAHAEHRPLIPDLPALMREARVVVVHGAMTMAEALTLGCRLVVVPRQCQFGEHVDDHQVEFSIWMQQDHPFQMVLDVKNLPEAIAAAGLAEPITLNPQRRLQLVSRLDTIIRSVGTR